MPYNLVALYLHDMLSDGLASIISDKNILGSHFYLSRASHTLPVYRSESSYYIYTNI